MDNEILDIVIKLSVLLLPFLGLVVINTEYFTKYFNWEGKAAQLASSAIGLILFGMILLAFFVPVTVPYVAGIIFLDIGWCGPSGSHDLITKFAEKIGK